MKYRDRLVGLEPELLRKIDTAQAEIDWLRNASGQDLLRLATDQLGLRPIPDLGADVTAVAFGNLEHGALLRLLEGRFARGTTTAEDLADQVQLNRAFADPQTVTDLVVGWVEAAIANFPRASDQLRVGSNAGDVLDPFILAANFELLSERSLQRTIEHTASHKVLMKIEDLIGHLHQSVVGLMRGNFRVPEPQGTREEGKERLDSRLNPFPGADVGQVPLPERPESLRLFQVKSKTGSAKGGDGKRLGEQLSTLQATYGADTFYVAVVGNTLRGHRSRGAVSKASPDTAILVGRAAHNELTQSAVGGELLLRTYRRAFRVAAERSNFRFGEIVIAMAEDFATEADQEGTDFLSAWLHEAVGGRPEEQDSRLQVLQEGRRRRRA